MAPDTSHVDRPTARPCAWCHFPIPAGARVDAIYCKTACRQAAHRFRAGYELRPLTDRPMRLAYADPPYPKLARRYYLEHPDFAGEVDHRRLIDRLVDEFPDGWALSTSSAALQSVLELCPRGVRVAAWTRGARHVAALGPLSAWEPVIYLGGRQDVTGVPSRRTDALVKTARPRTTDPYRVIGAKPADFAWWMFDLLGAEPGDDLVDLFPGSGGIARAWDIYSHGRPVPRGHERHVAGIPADA